LRKFVLVILLLAAALQAFGHAGEVHKYMGTVAAVRDDGSFTLKTTDGKTLQLQVAATTVYQHADGKPATRAALTAGKRVVATISTDGKTATLVKMAGGRGATK